jgi:hypothetical protein
MVECAHGNGVFSKIEKGERSELVTKLIALIKANTLSGFSAILHKSQFQAAARFSDAYVAAAEMCVNSLLSFLAVSTLEGNVSYFFEAGHNSQGRAYNHFARPLSKESAVTFAKKENLPLLQAADLLAWQSTKYVKDRTSGARPMRRDFESLMEHHHSLAYMFVRGNELELAFEDFPLSRRSQKSVALNFHTDGPINYACEDGDSTPIIVLDEPKEWRYGGGKLIQVYFTGLGSEKRLALAFDEPRLRWAIEALTNVLKEVQKQTDQDN